MSKAPAEHAPARSEALRGALDRAIGKPSSPADHELIAALAGLYTQCEGAEPLSSLVAKIAAQRGLRSRGSDQRSAPDLPELLFLMAKSDGLLLDPKKLRASILGCSNGCDPADGFPEAVGLARTSWWETLGLLLNEARPEQAPLWPICCALAGLDSAKVSRALANAGPLSAAHAEVRDELTLLACEARDSKLMEFAFGLKIDKDPGFGAERLSAAAEALARPHPHSSARSSLGLAKEPAMEAFDIACALMERFESKELASRLLLGSCKSHLCLPESLPPEWSKAFSKMRALGAAELSFDQAMELSAKAIELRAAAMASSHYGSSERGHWNGSRSIGIDELDALARACIKKAAMPRKIELGPQSPPLAFQLLDLLPQAGPKAAGAIVSAMEGWAKDGFGAKELAWSRAASGNSQSIGWAVANFSIKAKDSGGGWDAQIQSWLGALARQGFDFEAKASPKSKSLGERMRSTQTLKDFWPLVEAQMLRAAAPAAPSKKTPTL